MQPIRWASKTALLLVVVIVVRCCAGAVELKAKTVASYEKYLSAIEQKINAEQAGLNFFWGDIAAQDEKLRHGEILIEKGRLAPHEIARIPDGLLHHWSGFVFIEHVTLDRLLSFLQDYDHHQEFYKPEVAGSKLMQRDGDHFHVYLRFVKKKVITVVLNTEHDVRYFRTGTNRSYSRSHTTRVAEVIDPNQPNERERPVGEGGGYLWRMDTYWRFFEADEGVYVRCEAVSLTRSVPTGLGWLIGPFITSIPRESLFHTLNATRLAIKARP